MGQATPAHTLAVAEALFKALETFLTLSYVSVSMNRGETSGSAVVKLQILTVKNGTTQVAAKLCFKL